jgi:hypothetical protein
MFNIHLYDTTPLVTYISRCGDDESAWSSCSRTMVLVIIRDYLNKHEV